MRFSSAGSVLKQAGEEFLEDQAMSSAAALSFYMALGLAPILLLMLAIAGLLPLDAQERFVNQVQTLLSNNSPWGSAGSNEVATTLDGLMQKAREREQAMSTGTISMWISLATLIFSASGVFAQLQTALNQIWDVKARPGEGVWGWVRKRLLSFSLILGLVAILLASLAVSAAIGIFMPESGKVWGYVNWFMSLLIFATVFAMIFKFLPDVQIAWRDVWAGAATTALLFSLGKMGLGIYLARQSFASSYGAAGSLIALLVWVYYSSIIVFFGAELTQVVARRYGSGIEPNKHAVRDVVSHSADVKAAT